MTHPLTAGKARRLTTLADASGFFKMIAVDQRPPLMAVLAREKNLEPENVPYEELKNIKHLLTRALSHAGSAILVDPVWGHAGALLDVPGRVGLLSTLEDHRFEVRGGERYSHTIDGWSVAKIARSGAAGVKLLVWHRPDVREETQAHQDELVMRVGAACREHDVPLILELLIYPKPGEVVDSLAYARAKPELVKGSIAHYSQEAFGVDVLKVEFPADLKHTREFSRGAFDGQEREAAYDLATVREHLLALDASTNVPWVLLSAGVGPREFALNVELAAAAGSAGYLAGRAVWMNAINAYPKMAEVERRLHEESAPYLRRLAAIAETGRPWFEHPRYAGEVQVADAAAGGEWYRRYAAEATA